MFHVMKSLLCSLVNIIPMGTRFSNPTNSENYIDESPQFPKWITGNNGEKHSYSCDLVLQLSTLVLGNKATTPRIAVGLTYTPGVPFLHLIPSRYAFLSF